MNIFSKELERYLKLRQKDLTAESYSVMRRVLLNFKQFAISNKQEELRISEKLINSWITFISTNRVKRTVSDWVSHLRCFLRFLSFEGYDVFIPRCPKRSDSYVPYIFSDIEIEKIFKAADNLMLSRKQLSHSRIYLEFSMLLRLLYGCGLRLGEALVLTMENVNLHRGILYLRETKNDKQRIVPMETSLVNTLQKYCCAMKLTENPSALLFPGKDKMQPISSSYVSSIFRRILKETEIYVKPKAHTRGQCVHCFRHLFAIKSFAQTEQLGRSTDDSIPFLSVYLGHRDLDETEKYLKFSSDIFPEYTAMFENYSYGVFSEELL